MAVPPVPPHRFQPSPPGPDGTPLSPLPHSDPPPKKAAHLDSTRDVIGVESRLLSLDHGPEPTKEAIMRILLNTLAVLLALCSGALLVQGASQRVPNTPCQLSARYMGRLDASPMFTGQISCSGTCPTSRNCHLAFTRPPVSWAVAWTCSCPSGTNGDGCRGLLVTRPALHGDHLEHKLICLGACDDTEVCDWSSAPTPGGQTGDWARCACQPVQ